MNDFVKRRETLAGKTEEQKKIKKLKEKVSELTKIRNKLLQDIKKQKQKNPHKD